MPGYNPNISNFCFFTKIFILVYIVIVANKLADNFSLAELFWKGRAQ